MKPLGKLLIWMRLDAERGSHAEDLEQVRQRGLLPARGERVGERSMAVAEDRRAAGMRANPELRVRARGVDGGAGGVGVHAGDEAISVGGGDAPRIVLHSRDERHELAGEGEHGIRRAGGRGGGGERGGRHVDGGSGGEGGDGTRDEREGGGEEGRALGGGGSRCCTLG